MNDTVKAVKRFSSVTGIVDKDVDILIDGLFKYPAEEFLFTPFMVKPIYYPVVKRFEEQYLESWPDKGDGRYLGRGIAFNKNPRKRATLRGIKPY